MYDPQKSLNDTLAVDHIYEEYCERTNTLLGKVSFLDEKLSSKIFCQYFPFCYGGSRDLAVNNSS